MAKDEDGANEPQAMCCDSPCKVCEGVIDGKRTVLLSVSWTFPAAAEHALPQGQPDYLDGSCLIYGEEQLLDVIDFRGAHSSAVGCHSQRASSASYQWSAGRGHDAAVLHSGDVMTGDGGTHVIRVHLAELPPTATDCYFAVSAYNCRNLALFRSLNVRLSDAQAPGTVFAKLAVEDVPSRSSAVVVCALRRQQTGWQAQGLCFPCDATVRNYAPIEALLAPMQEHHVRWRRRGGLVLMAALLQCGRATFADGSGDEEDARLHELIAGIFRLPTVLFRCVVQFV